MTREDIIRMAREADLWMAGDVIEAVERFAQLVAAAEREACEKVAESYQDPFAGAAIADMIRARGRQ